MDHHAVLDDSLAIPVQPPFTTDLDAAASLFVDRSQFLLVSDDSTSQWKVRSLDVLRHQAGRFGLGVLDEMHTGGDHFAKVVGRDVGRHPDRDPRRSVDEQIREPRGEHDGLFESAVVVRPHVDRLKPQLVHELFGDGGQPGLGVSVGGRGQPHDRTEVPLPVDQRVAKCEVLRHSHKRVVDGLWPVRMVVPRGIAGDLGALVRLAVGGQPQPVVHDVEDAALHRLQSVAHIGQRAGRDDRHRVIQVSPPRLLAERHVLDSVFDHFTVTADGGCSLAALRQRLPP